MFLLFVVLVLIFVYLFNLITKGECKSNKCLQGKTAIVTGGNSGIGYQTVLNLASRGCRIIIADVVNAEETKTKVIRETGNSNILYKHLDLGSLESVRRFSKDILENEERLDILINNAGTAEFQGQFTSDGILKIMQINYLGHFLLTHLLVGLLKKTQNSRVVFVSSVMAFTNCVTNATDINVASRSKWILPITWYDYSTTKLCVLIASNIFARKLKQHGIIVNAVYPGVVKTPLIQAFSDIPICGISTMHCPFFVKTLVEIFGKTAREGAQTILHCVLSDSIAYGGFYFDCLNFLQPGTAKNTKLCNEIWKFSQELAKLSPNECI